MDDITTAPPRAKTARQTQKAGASAAAPKPSGAGDKLQQAAWYDAVCAAQKALDKLFAFAINLDLAEDDTSDMATRLISVASRVADDFLSDENVLAPYARACIAGDAFDVKAILVSALSYPGQPLGHERHLLLHHAIGIAELVTLVMDGGGERHIGDLMDAVGNAVRIGPAELTAAAPVPRPAPAAKVPPGAFTHEQHKEVLGTIAERARTLQQLLMVLQGDELEDDDAHAVCVDAAKIIANSIGACADASLGGYVLGEHDEWNYGPNFANLGKVRAS